MKRFMLVAAFAMFILMVGVTGIQAADDTVFVFEGAGWGHGVGMSQWGAYGQAVAHPDRSGEDIVAHYYPGSEVNAMSDLDLPNDLLTTLDRPLWINLGSHITLLEFTAVGGPLDLCLFGDGEGDCPKPEQPQEGERWEFRRMARNQCGFFQAGELQGTSGACRASIAWPEADGVQLRYGDGRAKICASSSSYECEYRHGELKIRDDPEEVGFHVVLAVSLEEYLRGVAELLHEWDEPGVNEAQVIAARSYAAFKFFQYETGGRPGNPETDPGISASRRNSCWCHMYDNTRDMNYIAWAKESRPDAGPWLEAVEKTRGRVLTYTGEGWTRYTKGGIIQAFFSASSGGVTSSNRYGFFSEWNGNAPRATPWPYLTPVTDPWDTAPVTGNRHASWERRVEAASIARSLGWESVTDARLETQASVSAPARIRFDGYRDGSPVSVTVAGAWIRIALGLRSSNITAIDGELSGPSEPVDTVDPPPAPLEEDPTLDIGNEGSGSSIPYDLLPPFPDAVNTAHAEGIQELRQRSITLGCGNGLNYCPDDVVTRGALATFLLRVLDLEPADGNRFTDVSAGHRHRGSINAIADLGLTNGCGAGNRYCPNDPVTRETMAVFVARALDLKPGAPNGKRFSDVPADHPRSGEIYAIADRGITVGCQDGGRFCPDEPVTRGSMATFIARAFIWKGTSPPSS